MEALSSEIGEWMRFVLKRLSLKSHASYLANGLLCSVIETLNGMVFNWAAFVATKIPVELTAKRKFTSVLSSNYVYAVIWYTLNLSVVERGKRPIQETQLPLAPSPSLPAVPLLTGVKPLVVFTCF